MKKSVSLVIVCLLTLLTLPLCAYADTYVLPADLLEIQDDAFRDNTSIDTVILPEGLLTIGSHAFAGSSVQLINLPSSVQSIADSAFEDCSSELEAFVESDSDGYWWCIDHGINAVYYEPITVGSATTAVIHDVRYSVFFRFIPTVTGRYSFTSSGDKDTAVCLYDETFNRLRYDDDGGSLLNFMLRYDFIAGVSYYFKVYLNDDQPGSFSVLLSEDFGPQITLHPVNVTAAAGTDAFFSVTASGTGALYYRWQELSGASTWQDTALSGSTTNTLRLHAETQDDGRQFRCVITDEYGLTAVSEAATLYVEPASAPRYRALLIAEVNFEGDLARPGFMYSIPKVKDILNSVRGPSGGHYTIYGGNNEYMDSSPGEILSLISTTFADARENDVSLFFIASHGIYLADDEQAGGIGTVRSTPDRVVQFSDGNYYNLQNLLIIKELAAALQAIPGKVIIWIDTCGSGAGVYSGEEEVSASANSGGGPTAAFDGARFNEALIRSFEEADVETWGLMPNTGELRVEHKFYVLTASAHKELSWSSNSLSVFTMALNDAISTSGAMPADSAPEDGVVTLRELYSHMYDFVLNLSLPEEQHIQVYPADSDYEMFIR